MANRESAKRAERRRRAKTTGVITLMLQAPRAGVVVALVRGGYLKAGVVPTDKELYEAAQRHYTDSLKDGVQVPRILAEQPPLGVKIESKAGKTAAQYDKHKARLYSKIYTPEEKGVFVQSRPDLAPDLATALAEAENHRKRVIKFNGKRTQFLGSPSTPPYVGPRRTKNTGHVPTVKDKRKSQAATVKPIKQMSKAALKKAEKALGLKMESDKGVHTLRPGKGGIERESDRCTAGELGYGKRKHTGEIHYRDDNEPGVPN